MKLVLALMTFGALALALAASPAAGGYVPVYGGPTYDPTTGTGYTAMSESFVNNAGTVVGTVIKNTADESGVRAIRWNASGVTELGNLGTSALSGFTQTGVTAINNDGAAAGYADKYVSGVNMGHRAIRWDASATAATELGNLGTDAFGNTDTFAAAINDAGTIVGTASKYISSVDMGYRAVRWDGSCTTATELGNLGTDASGLTRTQAYGINNTGTTVGCADKFVSGVWRTRAVRWDASGTAATELGNLGGTDQGVSYALAIGNGGTIVGEAEKYFSDDYFPGISMGTRAVRWDPFGTTITELGDLGTDASGYTYCSARFVNETGTAVGLAEKYVAGVKKGLYAVRWDASGTTATQLGILATDPSDPACSIVNAINKAGIAVGVDATLYDASGTSLEGKAVMWGLDGAAVDLNTLIDPDSGWTLYWARGISDNGWISGIGDYDPDGSGPLVAYGRLFIMQVPEPATLTLVGVGIAATLLRRRK